MKPNKTTLVLSSMAALVVMAVGFAAWTNRSSTRSPDEISATSKTSETLYLNRDQIRSLQSALNSQADASLSVDGIMGQRTVDAVKRFQFEKNLAVTGDLDSETLSLLGLDYTEVYRAPASVPERPDSMDKMPGSKRVLDTQMLE